MVEDTEAEKKWGFSLNTSLTNASKSKLLDGYKVFANIMNRESRRIQIQVQCVFQDENGFSVDDTTPWENVILTENAIKRLNYTSLSAKAKNFVIRVRQAR